MTKSNREVVDWMHKLVHEGAEMKLDSREVRPGDIFCAIPGTKSDGRAFIRVAAARGAAGVIYEADGTPQGSTIRWLRLRSRTLPRASEKLPRSFTATPPPE